MDDPDFLRQIIEDHLQDILEMQIPSTSAPSLTSAVVAAKVSETATSPA